MVESGANLVITAPTSAGKSLVADVLMLQVLRSQPDKAVLMVGVPSLAAVTNAYYASKKSSHTKSTTRYPVSQLILLGMALW
jgi:replicative superfamily II helicase